MLKELRERGFRCVLYEAGQSLGGTWRWNRYPGARVDSETPEYELSWPEVWRDVSTCFRYFLSFRRCLSPVEGKRISSDTVPRSKSGVNSGCFLRFQEYKKQC